MIKYFDHQGPKVVRVMHEIIIMIFEHLENTTWKDIDVEFTICVCRNSYGIIKTEICIDTLLSSLLDR